MEHKEINRGWVKNAAIIFLAVLLVLTFFSNTIMNRTLPEVATQSVTSGSITARVRGTGTVVANGSYQVKADQTREIRAVAVKTGQEVNQGDVLFILGQGDSDELEAATDALRDLEISYRKSAINMPTFDYSVQERKIASAQEKYDAAVKAEQEALDALNKALEDQQGAGYQEQVAVLEKKIENAQKTYDELATRAQAEREAAEQRVTDAEAALAAATPGTEEYDAAVKELADAKKALDELPNSDTYIALSSIQAQLDSLNAQLDALRSAAGEYATKYDEAKQARVAAEDELFELKHSLEQQKIADSKQTQLAAIDLESISAQIEKQKQKIKELSGGEENQITSNVSGTVQSIEITAGQTVPKDTILATIEVPDMGYTLSFSVTNEQARKLRPGDSATVSNFYWGSEIVATLNNIKTDPKNPQTNKLLTFDLDGDVNAGSELTISVGSKSANYDYVVPNSAIRQDNNGSFVLVITAKNSPLGNRFFAKRVTVEVVASDDMNSAVTGDFGYGDYVITTSSIPVKGGDQVRMAEST